MNGYPNNIEFNTKKAWEKNWELRDVEELLQIFSYPRVQKQIKLYLSFLPGENKILEGGCGLGPYLIYLRKLGYNVVGVDYNYDPIRKIKRYDASLPVSVMDVRNLSFINESFGGYLSLGVIEHFVEGPQKAIQEACRVLSKNGIFIVQVPIMNLFLMLKYPIEILKRNPFLRKLFGRKEKVYYWQQYFKKKELKIILENEGFVIESIIPMDHEHAILSFSKIFRDKMTYDGANAFGISLSKFCEKYFPWLTAANMVLICKKVKSK